MRRYYVNALPVQACAPVRGTDASCVLRGGLSDSVRLHGCAGARRGVQRRLAACSSGRLVDVVRAAIRSSILKRRALVAWRSITGRTWRRGC